MKIVDGLMAAGGLIAVTLGVVTLAVLNGTPDPYKEISKNYTHETPGRIQEITLTEKNTYVLSGEINSESAGAFIRELQTNPSPELYIYITSPGGSVLDGIKMISAMGASKKKITCIADVAISMATAIFHACPVRVITESSVIMQHQASYGIPLMPEKQVESFVNFSQQMIGFIQTLQANRQHMSVKELQDRIENNWWIFGINAFETDSADVLGLLSCSASMINSIEDRNVMTMFGPVAVTFSKCPLIENPVAIKAKSSQEADLVQKILKDSSLREKIPHS
jgi:ATP-dependent protease ClpP protease subunit